MYHDVGLLAHVGDVQHTCVVNRPREPWRQDRLRAVRHVTSSLLTFGSSNNKKLGAPSSPGISTTLPPSTAPRRP